MQAFVFRRNGVPSERVKQCGYRLLTTHVGWAPTNSPNNDADKGELFFTRLFLFPFDEPDSGFASSQVYAWRFWLFWKFKRILFMFRLFFLAFVFLFAIGFWLVDGLVCICGARTTWQFTRACIWNQRHTHKSIWSNHFFFLYIFHAYNTRTQGN